MLKTNKVKKVISFFMAFYITFCTTNFGFVTAYATTTGVNIITNGSADNGLYGWVFCDKSCWFTDYSSNYLGEPCECDRNNPEDNIFISFSAPTNTSFYQDIAVNGLDSKINAGGITANFSIYNYVYKSGDLVKLSLIFLNSSKNIILSDYKDFYDLLGWRKKQIKKVIPANTAYIRVMVTAQNQSKKYTFDGASLTLTENTHVNVPPAVSVSAATAITSTAATLNANITALGTPAAIEYGFCYGTGENPATDNNKISKGTPSVTGAYTADITGLTPNTSYYARAYAVNSNGTYYSSQICFTTLEPKSPAFTANTTNNNVDNNIEITFMPDKAYENAITGVSYNGTALIKDTDYDITSGKITLLPSRTGNAVLRTPATANLEVTAAGYKKASVQQTIQAGTVNSIVIEHQPVVGTASGDEFATKPAVTLKDKYGNVCADGPSATASVTAAAKAGTGKWTIGGTTAQTAVNGVAVFSDLICTSTKPGTGLIAFKCGDKTIDSSFFTLPKCGGLANISDTTIHIPCLLPAELVYSINLSDIIILNKSDTGTVSYIKDTLSNKDKIIKDDNITISGNILKFTLNPDINFNFSSTIKLRVITANYADLSVDLPVINDISLAAPVLIGAISTGNITYGDKLSVSAITGKFVDTKRGTVIAGKILWDTPDLILEAGIHTVNWTFMPADKLKYKDAKGTASVTVKKRPLTIALTQPSYSKTYGDTDPAFSYKITAGSLVGDDVLAEPVKYTGKNAGRYNIAADTAKNLNYNISLTNGAGAMTINKRVINIDIKIKDKIYDGTAAIEPENITASFINTITGETIGYNCIATPYADANANNNKQTDVTVTLTGDSLANYSLSKNKISASGNILKATTTANPVEPIIVRANVEREYMFCYSSIILNDIDLPKSTGEYIRYSIDSYTSDNYFVTPPHLGMSAPTISFTVSGMPITSSTIGEIVIKVDCQNYNTVYAEVPIIVVDKSEIEVSGVSVQSKIYDGTSVKPILYPKFLDKDTNHYINIDDVNYNYIGKNGTSYNSTTPPVNAGDYAIVASIPDSNVDYYGSTEIPFTISKAPLKVTAQNKTITVGDDMPMDYALSYSGFKNSETADTDDVFTTAPKASCKGNSDTATTYDITFNTPVSPNYEVTTVKGTLTVNAKASDSSFYTVSPSKNAKGWYNSDITVTAAGKDSFDKIRIGTTGSFAGSAPIGTEAASGSASLYFAKGLAATQPTTFTYKLDRTKPVLSNIVYDPAVSPIRGIYNFLTGSVSVSVDVSDNLSGVEKVSYELIDTNGVTAKTGTASVSGGKAVVSIAKSFAGAIKFTASDEADNAAAPLTSNFVIEDTAPTIGFSNIAPNSAGWHNKDVTLDILVKDNADSAISGGIKTINYTDNNGSSEYAPSTTVYEYTKQIVVSTEGGYTNTVTATDNSGNTYSKAVTIKLDKTAPNISEVKAIPIDAARLYNGYKLTISATDAGGSGIAGYSIDGGATWQTSNVFEILTTKTISSGSIKVKDTAGNITTYTAGDVVIAVPKITSYFKLTADKTNIKYGDKLTLTAEVTTDTGIAQELNGTVTFYLGSDNTGTKIAENVALVNGKATCEINKAIYSNAGTKSFFAVYSGNSNFEPSSKKIDNIAVAKLPLTVKVNDIACYSGSKLPEPDAVEYIGFIDGENKDNALTDNTIKPVHSALNTDTAGTYPITLSGDAVTPNYVITKQNGVLTVKIKVNDAIEAKPTDTPAADKPSVIVPAESVPDNVKLSDIRLIVNKPTEEEKTVMAKAVEEKIKEIPKSQVLQYDISLIDIANGNEIVQPKKGSFIKIVLPYPTGTDKSFTFSIVHLVGGITPEIIQCTNTDKGIEFSVKSFSPFLIGYVSNASGSSESGDISNTEQDFWDTVEREITYSNSGDVIKADLSQHINTVPVEVIETIKGDNAVLISEKAASVNDNSKNLSNNNDENNAKSVIIKTNSFDKILIKIAVSAAFITLLGSSIIIRFKRLRKRRIKNLR